MSEFKSITFVSATGTRRVEVDGEELRQLTVEISTLRARNAQLEANLLDYWAAHGAVKHIEEPRAVSELRAERDEWAEKARRLAEQLTECGMLLGSPMRDADREKIGDRFDPRTYYEAMTAAYTEACDEREVLRTERDAALANLDAERARRKQAEADLRQRTRERDVLTCTAQGLSEERDAALMKIARLEAAHEHCSTVAAYAEDSTRELLAERMSKLEGDVLGTARSAIEQLTAELNAARATVERVRELVAAWETWEESMRSWNGEKADVVADAVAELRSALQPEAQP